MVLGNSTSANRKHVIRVLSSIRVYLHTEISLEKAARVGPGLHRNKLNLSVAQFLGEKAALSAAAAPAAIAADAAAGPMGLPLSSAAGSGQHTPLSLCHASLW